MADLVLVRHGQSQWNALDQWTGLRDIDLTKQGEHEAAQLADLLTDMQFDICFTSKLIRAQHTLTIIKKKLNMNEVKTVKESALNERDYGDLTALKRSFVQQKYGREKFLKWRRGWDYPVPGGETLKDVYARVVPYYQNVILPHLKQGKNVLIVAHGNSLRALMKYLDRLSSKQITQLEMLFSEIIIYNVDKDGKIINKVVRRTTP